MDQLSPIHDQPPASGQVGQSPQDGNSSSGLNLFRVSRSDYEKSGTGEKSNQVEKNGLTAKDSQIDKFEDAQMFPAMGRFFAGLEQSATSSLARAVINAQTHAAARNPLPINSHENYSIPINHHYLDNNVVLQNIEAIKPSYTASTARDGTLNLNNVHGLTINFHAFGREEKLTVSAVTISKRADGATKFALQIDNPLPPPTAKVFNTPATIPFTFTMTASGKIVLPKDSEMFASLAGQSGGTLPGMVLRDAFADAGSVAGFIENNNTWVNNILAPFTARFGKDLRADLNANSPSAAPTDSTKAVIGHIVQAGAASNPAPTARPGKIQTSGDYRETMKIDGRDRNFFIHVPKDYDPEKPMPMVVLVHGLSQTGDSLQSMLDSNKVADKEGFIAVYPDSINWFNVQDLRTWDSGNGLVLPGQHAGDIQFMDNVIKTAKTQLNVDANRVFMVGHSNGGMFTYRAAAALSGELAGIGIMSSAMSGSEPAPKEPLSMINVHGTKDSIIPIEGITDTPPVLKDVGVPVFQPAQYGTDYYAKLDGITAPFTVSHAGKQTIKTAENPLNGTAVEQITIAGADHVFNNSPQILSQVLEFLNAHPKMTPPNAKDDVIKEPDIPVEQLTTVQQLENDVKTRGVGGIEQDIDNAFDATRAISNNSISPSAIFDNISRSTHIAFSDPVSRFIQNTTKISKKQDQIVIDRTAIANIPLDVGFGVGALKSMDVSSVSFDLAKNNGYPELKNITGITLNAQVAGRNLASKINDITELPDGPNGSYGRVYRATMENPMPSWARTVLLSPDQFNVDLKFDANMNPLVVNQRMTELQLLGKNPWVNGIADEAQDAVNLKDNISLLNTVKVGSDIGLTAGITYLGFRLATRFGGTRAKIVGGLCFLAAPMAIDFVRKEFAP